MKRIVAVLAIALTVLVLPSAAGAQSKALALTDCSGDVSTSLANFLNNRPANATVTLKKDGCYTLSTTMLLRDITGLTIHGNGATLALTTQDGGFVPILELWNDSKIKIDHLTFDGGATPTDPGGEDDEGDYGILMEADTNVTISQSNIQNTQGDWIFLSQPYDVPEFDPQINTGITFSQDTFLNVGYHGLTVESVGCPTTAACNGLTVANSTLTNMNTDAMDFEVDDFSSGIAPNGVPNYSVENWVTIKNNVWNNWGNDWFASIQGQVYNQPISTTYNGTGGVTVASINASGHLALSGAIPADNPVTTNTNPQAGVGAIKASGGGLQPFTYTSWSGSTLGGVVITGGSSSTMSTHAPVTYGNGCPSSILTGCGGVSEQHLVITGNTLNANAPFMEVVGSPTFYTTTPYLDLDWTVKNNNFGKGFYAAPYRGGSTPTASLYSVAGMDMENNDIHFCAGQAAGPCSDSPSEYFMELFNSVYSTYKNNNFSGALNTRDPGIGGSTRVLAICHNRIGSGTSFDAAC